MKLRTPPLRAYEHASATSLPGHGDNFLFNVARMTQSRLDPGASCVSSCAQPVFLPSMLCTRCFAFARIGFALLGMSIATSRHEPPLYDQAGHGNDRAGTAISRPEMTKPGTDMVCDMIRPEGMSCPSGTAM